MLKLNQVIALVAGRKPKATEALIAAHRIGNDSVSGLVRSYSPKTEDGERLPPEQKLPNVNLAEELKGVVASLSGLYQAVATQETGNTKACADICLDGEVLISQCPVTLLLFLEKQLLDMRTLVEKLSVLPADREWHFDSGRNCFVSEPIDTLRTKKVLRNHVKAEATDVHPAQVEVFSEDATIGTWTTTHLSTALEATDKANALERVTALLEAVKLARESANMVDVENVVLLLPVLDYVFRPLTRRVQPQS